MPVERRLAAILAADVAGYSRLMGADEEGTLAALSAHRTELIEPCIAEHRGRVVKTTGDGLLAEFASVVDAVRCAVAFQEGMAVRNAEAAAGIRIDFRIGINLGDVIVQDDDVYGDGVNIASRLEGLAPPGGIVVSATVREQVKAKLDLDFEDLGAQSVKNIVEPVHSYRIFGRSAGAVENSESVFGLPAIAVLPFDNLSGDSEQEYFSDGITEDLTTALSHVRQLRVVARNSAFVYKARPVDVRTAAHELGVRYVVEGSVRKAGQRIRLTAQLIDGRSGQHIWAKRFDRDLDDIFALQDEIVTAIAAEIEPEIMRSEHARAQTKSPENLDAWEAYQRGMWHAHRPTKEDLAAARDLFRRATTLDPRFSPAHSGLAWTYFYESLYGFTARNTDEAFQAAENAVRIDGQDSSARSAMGLAYIIRKKPEDAIRELRLALELNPSYAFAHHLMARALALSGRAPEALPHADLAVRLSPNDPAAGRFQGAVSLCNLLLHRHEEAVRSGREALHYPDVAWPVHIFLISSLGHLDRRAEAKDEIEAMRSRFGNIGLSTVMQRIPMTDADAIRHVLDGLRKAGLPE